MPLGRERVENVWHRSAERAASQTGYPVISVSHSMSIVTVYLSGERHVLADSATICPYFGGCQPPDHVPVHPRVAHHAALADLLAPRLELRFDQ